jgi:hypothetical protein
VAHRADIGQRGTLDLKTTFLAPRASRTQGAP